MSAARAIGKAVGWNDDFASMQSRMLGPAMTAAVALARKEIDAAESTMRRLMRCGGPAAQPGCAVTVRYLAQASRVAGWFSIQLPVSQIRCRMPPSM